MVSAATTVDLVCLVSGIAYFSSPGVEIQVCRLHVRPIKNFSSMSRN
jgi:hypothetical protein